MEDFIIDPEIAELLPALTKEERNQLEANVLESLHLDAVVVGLLDGKRYLLDGHNRAPIALAHGLHLPVREKKFSTREQMIQWVIDNQLGRRNLTDERRAYFIGKEYLNKKKNVGNPNLVDQPNPNGETVTTLGKTSENVAKRHGVSARTVQTNAIFAEAVDQLPPPEKGAVLAGVVPETKKQIIGGAVPILCKRCKLTGPTKDCHRCAELREARKNRKDLCERCQKVGYQEGCTGCEELREKPKPEIVKDDNGTIVPVRLIPVFETVPLFSAADKKMTACAKAFKAIEGSPAKEAKPLDPSKPFMRFFPVFKEARRRLEDLRPALVCGQCGGDGCEDCRELGWLTNEMAQAKAIPA